ncbi:MAG TPA: radical SAM protein [Syntrophales bacterium]|nr:radical SAM protein [Syntrophales bacterium]
MPRLLLINPSNAHKGLGNAEATSWPPLNLSYVAAATPGHYQIELIDENIEPFAYREADIVGITAYTASVFRGYQIARIYRDRGIPTVMGGIHVSMLPDEALRYCDTVVVGEAESVWPRVLADFEAGRLGKLYKGGWESLENLPTPRRDLLRNDIYRWGSLQTSRGCPMDCIFCSVTAFNGRRFRRRPLESVVGELEGIPQRMVMLTDDNIIGFGREDRDWAFAFFSRILERGIRKHFFAQASIQFGEDPDLIRIAAQAGLRIVFVGMESINADTLRAYNKSLNLQRLHQNRYRELIAAIRRGGIAFHGAFVLGGDEDGPDVFDQTLQFVRSSHIDVLQLTKPTPLPGTRLWEQLRRDGRILQENFPEAWDDYRLTKLAFQPAQMSIDDVYEGFTYLRQRYYGAWETVKRTLNTLWTTRNPVAAAMAYGFNASYHSAFRNSEHYRLFGRRDLDGKFRRA